MMIRKFVTAALLSGLCQAGIADHTFRVSAEYLKKLSYVAVAEIRVNGVTAESVEEVVVPDGADVTVVFKKSSGYIWGADTYVYSNVTEDMIVSVLPKPLVSYRGSASDPIRIASVDDLKRLQEMSIADSFKDVHFLQTADLDLSEFGPWEAIGGGFVFKGYYDGGNHRIDNLTLANGTRVGLFGYVSNATIQNLTVQFCGYENPSRMNCGGAIVANAEEDVRLIHLIAEGELPNSNNPAAGIAVVACRGEMTGCTNRLDITGISSQFGGLVATCKYVWSGKYKGLKLTDCVNEGRLTNMRSGAVAGGLIGEISGNQETTISRCENRGEIISDQKASLIGRFVSSANTAVTVSDSAGEADLPPIAVVADGVRNISGLNFATVSSDVATFCSTPASAGEFKVMLENADPIVLSGVKVGDRLVLEDFGKYSGVVSCSDESLTVKGADGVWTVGKNMSVDMGLLVESTEPGVFELQPAANQVSVTIDGFDGERLRIPGRIEFVRGVPLSRLSVANGGYDVTAAVSFGGDEETGYALALDGSAVVKGVKVTPTIGEGVSDAFRFSGSPSITIQSIPGLWYELVRGDSPIQIGEVCEVKMAEGETIALADNLTPLTGAFYRVKVFLSNPVGD